MAGKETYINKTVYLIWAGICWLYIVHCNTLHAQLTANRYEINAKRIGLDPTDKEALPRGREFVRLDSTYYPGWMFQGLYLHDRSADKEGYRNALPNLKKSFDLLEKDFTPVLKTIFSSAGLYTQHTVVYSDYLLTGRALKACYEYLDMPDSAMFVLNRISDKGFKKDDFGVYGSRAWLIHRNRFYTGSQYAFLKNTVAENEQLALAACYEGLGSTSQHEAQLNNWFGPYSADGQRMYIYHYLAMIHSYIQQYDSSEYYYKLMADWGQVSWNNYGSLKLETGDFENATALYALDKYNYTGDKRLMEPYYYLPMLDVYAGNTQQAIETAKEAIEFSQSSPGFGWYHIALARAYLYNGQLDSADATLTLADNFAEVHIGTTLTQQQYDFTIQMLRLVWYNKKIAAVKTVHRGWWYNPASIYELITLWAKRYADKYVLASILSENPERDRIIYDMFCGESTVSFDEILVIMQTFSPRYFARLMEEKADTDPRLAVRKYFDLARAEMQWQMGNEAKTLTMAKEILATQDKLNKQHEKLWLARIYELIARGSSGAQQQAALNEMYTLYPELLPFTGLPVRIGLQINSDDESITKIIRKQLNQTNIKWMNPDAPDIPLAAIYIEKKDNRYTLIIDTKNAAGKNVVVGEKILWEPHQAVGEELLFRIFGKKGAMEISAP